MSMSRVINKGSNNKAAPSADVAVYYTAVKSGQIALVPGSLGN